MVDRNLFLHDLAVVAIMKNEGPYLREWLDYHILAGVDHFYLYDNDSPDNQREVAAPYVKAGLVDYIPAPGKLRQHSSYNDAVKQFKFLCRYIAFVDGDEFIYPKLTKGGITDIVDEILSPNPNAAGLAINWHCFGSGGQEKADYSRGVLERFTRCTTQDNTYFNKAYKTVLNPRKVNFISSAHYAFYFEGLYAINERGNVIQESFTKSISTEKIVINHYRTKSREEYLQKAARGIATSLDEDFYTETLFNKYDRNDEFDDGILRYRFERAKNFRPPDKSHADERLLNALMINLSPTLVPTTPQKFYAGKMETFLTCRAVAAYLKSRLSDDAPAKFFEEAALKAILRSFDGASFADARLFLRELPTLLNLPYPAAKEIRRAALGIIPQIMDAYRLNYMFKDYVELDNIRDYLKIGG